MANFLYTDLIDEVLPYLAADPSDPVTEAAIRRTVIEFCRESWIWKHIADTQHLRARVQAYDIEPPLGADIVTVMTATAAGRDIQARRPDWLDENHPYWKSDTGIVRYFTQIDTSQILLVNIPDETLANGLQMTLALQPTQAAESFPQWIGNKYIYQLAEGAISRLMLMNKKPWSDMKEGAYRRGLFDSAIAAARSDAVSGLARAPTRTTSYH